MPENISKTHLIEKVAENTGMNRNQVKAVVDGLFEHMSKHLTQGDRISISGFGSFEVRERSARQGIKPGTSERIEIAASKYPAFKPGKGLKDSVNNRSF